MEAREGIEKNISIKVKEALMKQGQGFADLLCLLNSGQGSDILMGEIALSPPETAFVILNKELPVQTQYG